MMKEMGKTDPNYAIFFVSIPMYEPLEIIKCQKCGKIIAEPKELIGIKQEI